MQEKTMFTFGSKEGIHHFKANPHLAGSWVGNGNNHLSKLNGSPKTFWWPSWAAWFEASGLAGHLGKPKTCQIEEAVLGYFRVLWSRPSALEELSIGEHRAGSVRQWLQCQW